MSESCFLLLLEIAINVWIVPYLFKESMVTYRLAKFEVGLGFLNLVLLIHLAKTFYSVLPAMYPSLPSLIFNLK